MKLKLSRFFILAIITGIAGLTITLIKSNIHEPVNNNKNIDMKYFVTKENWISDFPNPIELKQNDTVEIVRKYVGNPNWEGWVLCNTTNNSGYVPMQIIESISENKGLIIEDYSAKELNIKKGEKVLGLKELNGWAWVKKESDGEEGWLPLDILTEISKNELGNKL